MKKHSIQINVSVGLTKQEGQKADNLTLANTVNCSATSSGQAEINKSGLNGVKVLQSVDKSEFSTVNCKTFSEVNRSLEAPVGLQKINKLD